MRRKLVEIQTMKMFQQEEEERYSHSNIAPSIHQHTRSAHINHSTARRAHIYTERGRETYLAFSAVRQEVIGVEAAEMDEIRVSNLGLLRQRRNLIIRATLAAIAKIQHFILVKLHFGL